MHIYIYTHRFGVEFKIFMCRWCTCNVSRQNGFGSIRSVSLKPPKFTERAQTTCFGDSIRHTWLVMFIMF